jgi:aconitate hydratase
LRQTARSQDLVKLVEYYAKAQGLYRGEESPDPEYSTTLTLDMGTVESSLAGPKRPQDRVSLQKMKSSFNTALSEIFNKSPNEAKTEKTEDGISPDETGSNQDNLDANITHGSVVIAAITSCTNTSNPSVMIAAGLIARKALEKGLLTKPWVKTSFAPGSRVVTEYLKKSGLMKDLEAQRFHLVGYGCTTCIGNSGPLSEQIDNKIKRDDLVVAAVLSGNRNFEGRIHASVRANYLASPPLVVLYALAGRIDIDFESEPIGQDKNGQPIYSKEIWPSQQEVSKLMKTALDAQVYKEKYGQVFEGDKHWRSLQIEGGKLFDWDPNSTYIKNPPFFSDLSSEKPKRLNIKGARVIALLGDSVTTDHISPAGTIPHDSPAGKYLISKGVEIKDFNSFGSRRGNHEIMMRGTFGNIRIKNKLLENVEGGYTIYFPTGEKKSIYDAAIEYQKNNIPLLVFAGKEYGTGSSRDWAAKGTFLLGIKAVIAESFERIHRSNLVGMGVLPLQFHSGDNIEKLGLTGRETFEITGIEEDLYPGKEIIITAINEENVKTTFNVKARLDTPIDVEYYQNGGILQTVVRQMINNH